MNNKPKYKVVDWVVIDFDSLPDLTEEAKNHPHPEVPYFSPILCGQDRCQMFVEL